MREISLHILDIAQNSIAASASTIIIRAEADEKSDRLIITIEDNGCGMSPKLLANVTDPFVTTRTTRNVGLGIPMLMAAAELCGGGVDIESAPGNGTKIKAVFGLSHIDREPYGDITSTIISLIVPNPEISFRYEHRINGREFVLYTDEIKAQLEDVPITDPTVVKWLRDYISEHIIAMGNIT